MRRMLQVTVGFTWLAVLFGCAGGNPLVTLSYLFNNEEPKRLADYPLVPQPGKEKLPVRVFVLVSMKPGASEEGEYIGAEKILNSNLIQFLETRCKENKENVEVLKYSTIEKIKKNNPTWRQWTPDQWKEKLGADYMIDVEVTKISTFMKGTYERMMKGRADVTASVYDLSKPGNEPPDKEFPFNIEFPKAREVEVSDETPDAFRKRFLSRIASDISLKFTAYATRNEVAVD